MKIRKYKIDDYIHLANYDGSNALIGKIYHINNRQYLVKWSADVGCHASDYEYSVEYLDRHKCIRLATKAEVVLFGDKDL
jgi:hypothetical protein